MIAPISFFKKPQHAELLRQYELLEEIYRGQPVGLILIDQELRPVHYNNRLPLLQPSSSDSRLKTKQITPHLAQEIEPMIHQVFETGESVLNFNLHGPAALSSSRIGDWKISGHALKSAEGKIGAVVIVIEEAHHPLHPNEQTLQAFFEVEPECIKLLGPEGTLREINPAGLRMIEVDQAEDILGKSLYPLVVPEYQTAVRETIENAQRGEKGGLEFKILGLRGTLRWINMTVAPFRDAITRENLVLAVSRDITEHKLLQEKFLQAQKMDAIGRLASGVAHDFNNLLTVIQGNATLLLMDQNDEGQQKEFAQDIIQAAERAADLTRQLLLLSRKQVLQRTHFDLNEVVRNLSKMLQRLLGESIRLETNYAPRLPLLDADIGMIEQILLNLVVNARDAMPSGGCLTIATGAGDADKKQLRHNPEAKPGLHVSLSVSDTGTGIAPEILPRIFEPFFTTKEPEKGTGLGLATVYGIVQQHEGWIQVTSLPGEGATFRIYLPAVEANRAVIEAEAATLATYRGDETILVVEDDPNLRLLACNLLQRGGYTVLAAANGPAALELWQEHRRPIDLLLTDMVMPDGVTGRQLAEKLQREKQDLKIVYTSGYSTDIIRQDMPLVEGINFLQKPYPSAKLTQTVRRCLDQK